MVPYQEPLHLYLDTCCLSRLFDDHTQVRVWLESQAVEFILRKASDGLFCLVGSDLLGYEIQQIPDERKRDRILAIHDEFLETVSVGSFEGMKAKEF